MRYRPRFGILEGRYLPSTVTTLQDVVPGSLRDAIATTPPGGKLDFEPGLAGTIILTAGVLALSQDVTIAGPGSALITVSGNNTSQVFLIPSTTTATIFGLNIASVLATATPTAVAAGGGLLNAGTLTLSSCVVGGNQAMGGNGANQIDAYGGGIYNSGTLDG
jgi:hypothetical protein